MTGGPGRRADTGALIVGLTPLPIESIAFEGWGCGIRREAEARVVKQGRRHERAQPGPRRPDRQRRRMPARDRLLPGNAAASGTVGRSAQASHRRQPGARVVPRPAMRPEAGAAGPP